MSNLNTDIADTIENYPYEQFEKDIDFYRNSYLTEIKERNNYFLIGSGAAITFLVNISKDFKGWTHFFIWIEVSILLILGLSTFYSMHLRTKVSKNYINIYNNFYSDYIKSNKTLTTDELWDRLMKNTSMDKLNDLENIIIKIFYIAVGLLLVLLLFILSIKFKETIGYFQNINYIIFFN